MDESARLDKALVQRSFALSRERAKDLIKGGAVLVNSVVITDPAEKVHATDAISLTRQDIPWVARSALKLDYALTYFAIGVSGLSILDIGASTGGFTEVLLYHGAQKVMALDVGHGQLHPRLKADTRVINMEGMHINELSKKDFPNTIDLITVDVSFISVIKILDKIKELLPKKGKAVVLIKPQFEVGRVAINKGVVKDQKLHKKAVNSVLSYADKIGLSATEVIASPIEGTDGNKEFLVVFTAQ